jgi:hypothetical protein
LSAFTLAVPSIAFAQTSSVESRKPPSSLLKSVKPRSVHQRDSIAAFGGFKNAGVNWSDQFTTPEFDPNSNAESVGPYTVICTPPESGQTTLIQGPIIPVTIDLLDSDGKWPPTTANR